MLKETKNKVPVIKSHVLKGLNHGFFTRQGGVSTGIFKSLNCSFRDEDARENVLKNRSLAMEALGLQDKTLLTLKQVHSADVVTVKDAWAFDTAPEADAMVTTDAQFVLGVQTADCVPLLLADRAAGVIGAAHGGWRGVLKGVVENTLDAMVSMGAQLENIMAAIGPCIGQDSYEVGPEVREAFLEKDEAYREFFEHREFPESFQFNLPKLVRHALQAKGVEVERLPYDTYENEDLFFSCRRAQHEKSPGFGGHISLISLELADHDL